MKALIIDDEAKARDVLEIILSENCPSIREVSAAHDLLRGVELIHSFAPDVVFLDIEMPKYSGLKLTEFINPKDINFQIIFTTAYSEYAIEAFKLSAIDYLLKPLRPSQVQEAVLKAEEKQGEITIGSRLVELKSILASERFDKIALTVSNGIKFVPLREIIYFEANGMYTNVYTQNEGKLLISKPIGHFSKILEKRDLFYKSHRSFLINLQHIRQFVKSEGGYIIMDNDQIVSLSKEKRSEFLDLVAHNS